MKTIRRSTCALSGHAIRLVTDGSVYALIVAGEAHDFGRDRVTAELTFASLVSL